MHEAEVMNGQWAVTLENGEWHVVPIGDLKDHTLHVTCGCTPVRDDEDHRILLHNAWDGREAFETGERKLS